MSLKRCKMFLCNYDDETTSGCVKMSKNRKRRNLFESVKSQAYKMPNVQIAFSRPQVATAVSSRFLHDYSHKQSRINLVSYFDKFKITITQLVFTLMILFINQSLVTTAHQVSLAPTVNWHQSGQHTLGWQLREHQTSDLVQRGSTSSRHPMNLAASRWPMYKTSVDEQEKTSVSSGQAETKLDSESKILALHGQLTALRRQLERELTKSTNNRLHQHLNDNDKQQVDEARTTQHRPRSIRLGSPCIATSDCMRTIRYSHCKLETFTCSCLDQHVEFNSTTCLAPALLGYECTLDAQCQQKVPESVCQLGKCACRSQGETKFISYRKNKCLPAAKIDDYCLADGQCHLNDKHSYCKWKIPNIYGTCNCPPNYKLLTSLTTGRLQCAPRLGDTCLSDRECQLATQNSICLDRQSANDATSTIVNLNKGRTEPRRRNSWLSSNASTARCTCAAGFVWSRSQLECLKEEIKPTSGKDTKNTQTTTTTQALESHKYETVMVASEEQQGHAGDEPQEINFVALTLATPSRATITTTWTPLSSIGTTTTPESKTTTTTTTTTIATQVRVTYENETTVAPTRLVRMSSLGKACSSRQECQMQDPYSDCIGGVCECQAPSERCSARSTGCHPGTFQCRNGQCISWYFVCDQFNNCDDGSDEEACNRSGSAGTECPVESFKCHKGGLCLTRGKVCNGKRECPDGSDEFGCTGTSALSTRPGNLSQVEEEGDTGRAGGGCPENSFACYNGQCLPAYVFCNAVEDCADASDEDERLCGRTGGGGDDDAISSAPDKPNLSPFLTITTTTTSRPQEEASNSSGPTDSPLVKMDRASIERLMGALALTQRTPEKRGRRSKMLSAHEQPQSMKMTTTTTTATVIQNDECPRWAFTCRNGKCRSSAILCSGVDGCGDNSDEDRCEVCRCEPPPSLQSQPPTTTATTTTTTTDRPAVTIRARRHHRMQAAIDLDESNRRKLNIIAHTKSNAPRMAVVN